MMTFSCLIEGLSGVGSIAMGTVFHKQSHGDRQIDAVTSATSDPPFICRGGAPHATADYIGSVSGLLRTVRPVTRKLFCPWLRSYLLAFRKGHSLRVERHVS